MYRPNLEQMMMFFIFTPKKLVSPRKRMMMKSSVFTGHLLTASSPNLTMMTPLFSILFPTLALSPRSLMPKGSMVNSLVCQPLIRPSEVSEP